MWAFQLKRYYLVLCSILQILLDIQSLFLILIFERYIVSTMTYKESLKLSSLTKLVSLLSIENNFVLPIFSIAASYFIYKMTWKPKNSHRRRISFTSASMAMGPWPEKVNMCDPIINAAIFMDEIPDRIELLKLVEHALTFERMAGVPTGTVGKNDWYFREIEQIDPNSLIREVSMAGNERDLIDFIGVHMQDSLRDPVSRGQELPWWEFLVIKNTGTCSSAVVLRIEHVLADGLSLVKLFEQFLRREDGSPVGELIPKSMGNKFKKQKKNKLSMYCKVIPSLGKVLTLPSSKFDHDTTFSKAANKNMTYSGNRKAIVFKTIPLALIKDLKNAYGVTVNDVLFTSLSIAISSYNGDCSVTSKKGKRLQCRALMPIALPRSDDDNVTKSKALRNKW